jgi:hypothetical protein
MILGCDAIHNANDLAIGSGAVAFQLCFTLNV